MTVQELNTVLGNNIKLYRRLKNLSQTQLAERLDITTQQLSKWETGQAMIRGINLVLLAQALNVEAWELFYTGEVVFTKNYEKLQGIYEVNNDKRTNTGV